MRRITLAEVDQTRNSAGRSLLLFLTDRCPVGCAHCSVDSRPDSPSITDYALFEQLLAGICQRDSLSLIGISGGEPFVERRGLTLAVDHLNAAGKEIVLYTSGVWVNSTVAGWINDVLSRVNTVFLSTDAFHAATVDDERFVRAAQTIVQAGAGLVVQVLNRPEMVERARNLLQKAFGEDAASCAELSLIPPLPYGRANLLFQRQNKQPGASFGSCQALAAPVVRYDGKIAVCCNERVITGYGPTNLRRQVTSATELNFYLDEIASNPLLNLLSGAGAGKVTLHPKFADLADQQFSSICELCFALHRRTTDQTTPDRLLQALAVLTKA